MEYRMGKQLQRYKMLLNFVSAVVVYGFCYIYGYVFQAIDLEVPLSLLLTAFTAFELLVIFLIDRALRWYQKHFYYVLLEDRLIVHGRAGEECFFWHEFQTARFDYSRIISMNYLPVIFDVRGRSLRLSRYVDGFNDLTLRILRRIQGMAEIEALLQQKMEIEK